MLPACAPCGMPLLCMQPQRALFSARSSAQPGAARTLPPHPQHPHLSARRLPRPWPPACGPPRPPPHAAPPLGQRRPGGRCSGWTALTGAAGAPGQGRRRVLGGSTMERRAQVAACVAWQSPPWRHGCGGRPRALLLDCKLPTAEAVTQRSAPASTTPTQHSACKQHAPTPPAEGAGMQQCTWARKALSSSRSSSSLARYAWSSTSRCRGGVGGVGVYIEWCSASPVQQLQ